MYLVQLVQHQLWTIIAAYQHNITYFKSCEANTSPVYLLAGTDCPKIWQQKRNILILNLNHCLHLMFSPPLPCLTLHYASCLIIVPVRFFLSLTFSSWWIYVNPCALFFLTLFEIAEHWPLVNVNPLKLHTAIHSRSKQINKTKTNRFA